MLLKSPQSAIEERCYVHFGELEAGNASEGQSFQRFQLRPTGGKKFRIISDMLYY